MRLTGFLQKYMKFIDGKHLRSKTNHYEKEFIVSEEIYIKIVLEFSKKANMEKYILEATLKPPEIKGEQPIPEIKTLYNIRTDQTRYNMNQVISRSFSDKIYLLIDGNGKIRVDIETNESDIGMVGWLYNLSRITINTETSRINVDDRLTNYQLVLDCINDPKNFAFVY